MLGEIIREASLSLLISEQGTRENIGPILVKGGHLKNMHGEKVEAFNAGLFVCFFFPQSLIIPGEIEPPGPGFSSWECFKPVSEEV